MRDIQDEAVDCLRYNPPALYHYLKQGAIWRPQIVQLSARWDATSPQQAPKKLTFAEQVTEDLFVTGVVYDVERPNFAAGSIDKPFSDQQNALRPGINVRVRVDGGFGTEQYPVNVAALPIQNALSQSQQDGPLKYIFARGFCLTYNQQIDFEAYLTRTLGETEIPYVLNVAVHGIKLGCKAMGGLNREEALQLLAKNYGLDLSQARVQLNR